MDTETKQSEKTPQSRIEEILKQIINPQTEENSGGNENEGGNTDGDVLFRDTVIIPDIHNCGCYDYEILEKYDIETSPSYGLYWYSTTRLGLDCNNGKSFRDVLTDTTITFKNIDFTDYEKFYLTNTWFSDSTRVPRNLKIKFINCFFRGLDSSYPIQFDTDGILFEFYNCTMQNASFCNANFYNCLIGGEKFYNDLGIEIFGTESNPIGNCLYKDCYFYDVEYPQTTSGTGHIDGMQMHADVDNIHLDNCRFECINMGFVSQGNWSYSIFWQGAITNSSIKNCISNGGGYYGLSILKAENQEFENNLVGATYNTPYYPDESGSLIQASDHAFESIEDIYVSSIWEEADKIKIMCTNDLDTEKTLTVVTDNGTTYNFTLDAGPTNANEENQLDWEDLPIDKVFSINSLGVKNIKCYAGEKLIRTWAQE